MPMCSTSKQNMYFDVLLTVDLSILISAFNQLDAQNLFHMFRAHVLETCRGMK